MGSQEWCCQDSDHDVSIHHQTYILIRMYVFTYYGAMNARRLAHCPNAKTE